MDGAVGEGAAGARLTCDCGRAVIVPALDKLRRGGVIVAPGAAVGANEHVRATIQSRAASERLVAALRSALG